MKWIAIIPALALFGLAGCEEPHYGYGDSGGQVISSGSVTRNPADVALEANIRSQMNRYGDLAVVSPNVQIYAQNGTVTLTGSIPNERDRQMMDALVRNSPGVTAVNDQLQIGYPPEGAYAPTPAPAPVYVNPQAEVVTPGPAAVVPGQYPYPVPGQYPYPYGRVLVSSPSDQTVASAIMDRMRWDSIPATWLQNVTITINDGTVYVQGSVDSRQERRAIVSAVQHAHGVRAVYDQLHVR